MEDSKENAEVVVLKDRYVQMFGKELRNTNIMDCDIQPWTLENMTMNTYLMLCLHFIVFLVLILIRRSLPYW